ncbi:hypothetical protein K1T71_012215 [Dendrolimus kikuchii]|uniref:Uncharacterized protein n=1 Tax=Dendrolimus kikuchii TaxID=765133 RepID=A0ACC1CL79_9NEOP|nr:hypothetical protein K1T71_012215 [Dendrolimus kikuchii]
MVSTRGVRYKFSEGERVLCYEPDPTKAKVLYDSKVLEVIESKDKRGRRTVEYLIHFQGWNSSWDRCVSEDFVLKDTEENRQLQRDLAEKSQLQLGAYLYRRERKKGANSVSGGAPAKRTRQGFSDDGSSTSTQPDDEVDNTGEESSSGSSSPSQSPPPSNGRAQIPLPSALRDRLTVDYHLVVKRGKLSRLPANPCAAQILEDFVKWFARAGAWHPPRGRNDPPYKPDLLDVSCRLNLLREVADGLRVYFDFILRGHLLYRQERNQYHEMCGRFIDKEEEPKKTEIEDDADEQVSADEVTSTSIEEDLKSPKIPEYSHLPPDPMDADKCDEASTNDNDESEDIAKNDLNEKSGGKSDSAPEDNQHNGSEETNGKPHAEKSASRVGNVARRLRSHKSVVSQSENDDPAPSTSTGEPRTFETLSSSVGSSGSSVSECWSRSVAPPPAPAAPQRTPLSLLLDKVAKWQIISREGSEHLPCMVYGAVHLARLFVKLPEFLNTAQIPDFKLKLVLKHIDMFVQYLDEHGEWFGETHYISDGPRSH